MHVLTNFLVTAALAAALPEPAKTTKTACSYLQSACTKPAKSYCSALYASTTTITTVDEILPTITAFPTDYPCMRADPVKAKRNIQNSETTIKTPACFRQLIKTSGTDAVSSACSCIGISTASIATVYESTAPTTTTTNFVIQRDSPDPNANNHAMEYETNGICGLGTQFKDGRIFAERYFLSSDCRLHDTFGNVAGIESGCGINGGVTWFSQSATPFNCTIEQDGTMECSAGASTIQYIDNSYSAGSWAIGTSVPPHGVQFTPYVTPEFFHGGR